MDDKLEGGIGELLVNNLVLNDASGKVLLAQTCLFQILLVIRNVKVVLDAFDLRLRLLHALDRVHQELDLPEGRVVTRAARVVHVVA
jgi:hypothetical protein